MRISGLAIDPRPVILMRDAEGLLPVAGAGHAVSKRRSESPTPSSAVRVAEPAPSRSLPHLVVNIGRHALPLGLLYWRGNIASYLLLTAFDLSLGLMLIVGTTRDRTDPTTVDPRAGWLISRLTAMLVLAVGFAIVAAIITVPVFMPAFLLGVSAGVNWLEVVSDPAFWVPVVGMSLLAGCQGQLSFESTTILGPSGGTTRQAPIIGNLEEDRRRSLAAQAAQITLLGTFVLLCYLSIYLGRWGLYAFPAVYTALLVFYDTRPDIAHRIFPDLWNKPGTRRHERTQP